MQRSKPAGTAFATRDDVHDAFGDIDAEQIIEILSLNPTIADIEEASVWLGGDPDVFGGAPVKGVVSAIVSILTENEEEDEPPPAG